MKHRVLSTVTIAALALTGCSDFGADDDFAMDDSSPMENSLFKGIYEFPACDTTPDDSNTMGTVNIVLPATFNGNAFGRSVNQGPPIPRDDKNPGNGWSPNEPGAKEPFDVFLDTSSIGTQKYWLIRMVLKPGQWRFLQDGNLSGVGVNDPVETALCDSEPTITTDATGANQAKYIATFYVDLEKLAALGDDANVPFTIALTAGNMGPDPVATPVLIDPKIRNDGTGFVAEQLTQTTGSDPGTTTEQNTDTGYE